VKDLVRDPGILARFTDGVLWATLGQSPDVLAGVNLWVAQLGGLEKSGAEAATHELKTLLDGRAALLIVDDVWNFLHLRSFLVESHSCRLVFTTREKGVARQVHLPDHAIVQMPIMTRDEALALLGGPLGRSLAGTSEEEPARQVARALGYLPLALELAAVRVADGGTWRDLLCALKDEAARLDQLQIPWTDEESDDEIKKSWSVLVSFKLSVRGLDDVARRRFAWLGLTAEEAVVTPRAAAVFWDTDDSAARETLVKLQYKALLQRAAAPNGADAGYQVHDLIRDYAKRLLVAPASPEFAGALPGFSVSISGGHAGILTRYKAQINGAPWHVLASDGYVHPHLIWHLEMAGMFGEIHALLRADGVGGHNGWYEAREHLGQRSGYLQDLDRAWTLAEQTTDSYSLGRGTRYALMMSSVTALAARIPPALSAALVEQGQWTVAQALANARHMGNSPRRAGTIAAIANQLTGPMVSEALLLLRSVSDGAEKARALLALTPLLSDQLVEQAWQMAWEMEDDQRIGVIVALIEHLPEHLVRRGLAAMRESDHPLIQVFLIGRLTVLGLAREARAFACEIDDPVYKTMALQDIGSKLPEPDRTHVLAEADRVAENIPNKFASNLMSPGRPASFEDFQRALAEAQRSPFFLELWTVLRRLPESLRYGAIRQAYVTLKASNTGGDGSSDLLNLSKHHRSLTLVSDLVPAEEMEHVPELLDEAIEDMANIEDGSGIQALGRMAPHFPPTLLARAFTACRSINSESLRAEALLTLIPHLDDRMLRIVWDGAMEFPVTARAKLLTVLVPRFPEAVTRPALERLLTDLRAAKEYERAAALESAAAIFPEMLIDDALEIALSISSLRAKALANLLPFIPARLLPACLTAAKELHGDELTLALRAVAVRFAALGCLSDALAALNAIQKPDRREETLDLLVTTLLERGRLADSLTAAQAICDREALASALAHLDSALPSELVEQALGLIEGIPDTLKQYQLLIYLVAYLPEPLWTRVFALIRESRTGQEWLAVHILEFAAKHIPESFLPEALDLALSLSDKPSNIGGNDRARALCALAPHLTAPSLKKAMSAAGELDNEGTRVMALLLTRYAELGRPETVLRLAEELAAAATGIIPTSGLPETTAAGLAVQFHNEILPLLLLASIAGQLPEVALAKAISQIEHCQNTELLDPLRNILSHSLARTERVQEAWPLARRIGNVEMRSSALLYLAECSRGNEFRELLTELATTILQIEPASERVRFMENVLPQLPREFRHPLAIAALNQAVEIGDMDTRISLFMAIARSSPGLDSDRGISPSAKEALFEAINHAGENAPALVVLVAHLGYCNEALRIIQILDEPNHRAEALIGMTPHLPDLSLAKAFETARGLNDEFYGPLTVASLSLRLAVPERRTALDAAVAAAREMRPKEVARDFGANLHVSGLWRRSFLMADVIARLAQAGYAREALNLAIEMEAEEDRIRALKKLGDILSELPAPELKRIWHDALHKLSTRPRQETLLAMAALSPILRALGTPDDRAEYAQAIMDVARWWP
jgi:NB-ARC domain